MFGYELAGSCEQTMNKKRLGQAVDNNNSLQAN